ncbi:hypothetical protein OIU77_009690 [Salix suchowensis]|uniref:Uncharacterized protein n=1 Tax=Salix suchowensis TaxID=1278906 RepID=A0ABQ9AF93_9ROSI|nr:hypothetical protein OIU77_009690 [Salix suchowensis]
MCIRILHLTSLLLSLWCLFALAVQPPLCTRSRILIDGDNRSYFPFGESSNDVFDSLKKKPHIPYEMYYIFEHCHFLMGVCTLLLILDFTQ